MRKMVVRKMQKEEFVQIRVPVSLRSEIKLLAVQEGLTMYEWLESVVANHKSGQAGKVSANDSNAAESEQ